VWRGSRDHRAPGPSGRGAWAQSSAGWPVRLHEALAAPRAEAGVYLDFLTQWTGHTLGEQDQIVAFHAAELARGAAYPGHPVAVAPLTGSAAGAH